MNLKRGQEVNLNETVNLEDVQFRLKDGESKKVVLCGVYDYVEFPSHNDFENKIYPQPCLLLTEKECPYCTASENGFSSLAVKTRFKFGFHSVDENKLVVWEGTISQGKKLIKQIQGFKEDIEYGTVFEFKRSGNGTDTSYTLTPIAERKYTEKDKKAIADAKVSTITDHFFQTVCKPKPRNLVIGLLNDMGVPVKKLFKDAELILKEYEEQTKESNIDDIV